MESNQISDETTSATRNTYTEHKIIIVYITICIYVFIYFLFYLV